MLLNKGREGVLKSLRFIIKSKESHFMEEKQDIIV